ncbi:MULTISPECIES: phage tail assembly chaperone [Sphingomonas]|uniref:Phage tail assembly chaperone n=2 Tax=Sphingomonas TaxID=13687 RepID=A0ABY2QMK5_9SPHN|nr:phage tail assembly chaperone [Sphingomonas olei]THG41125.1 phage tail assembly chaperone [Sphingomonas olei]
MRSATAAPRPGDSFAEAAVRLAGLSGVLFGWSPHAFWGATPAELAALVRVLGGADGAGEAGPPDAAMIAALKRAFPDG